MPTLEPFETLLESGVFGLEVINMQLLVIDNLLPLFLQSHHLLILELVNGHYQIHFLSGISKLQPKVVDFFDIRTWVDWEPPG